MGDFFKGHGLYGLVLDITVYQHCFPDRPAGITETQMLQPCAAPDRSVCRMPDAVRHIAPSGNTACPAGRWCLRLCTRLFPRRPHRIAGKNLLSARSVCLSQSTCGRSFSPFRFHRQFSVRCRRCNHRRLDGKSP